MKTIFFPFVIVLEPDPNLDPGELVLSVMSVTEQKVSLKNEFFASTLLFLLDKI